MNEEALRDLQLKAKLAEYDVLKTEIQYRGEFQQRILQLQVTALSAIIGIAFLQTIAVPAETKYWAVYLIPIVSYLLGFLYFNNSIRIVFIASYLYELEKEVNEIVEKPGLLRWEIQLRASEAITSMSKGSRILHIDYRVFWVLDLPALIALSIAVSWLLLYVPWIRDFAETLARVPTGTFAPFSHQAMFIQFGLLLAIIVLAYAFYIFRRRIHKAQTGPLTQKMQDEVEQYILSGGKINSSSQSPAQQASDPTI